MEAIFTIFALIATLFLFFVGIQLYFKLITKRVKKIFSGPQNGITNTLWKLFLAILNILGITILFLLLVAISIAAIVEGGLQFFLGLIGGLILIIAMIGFVIFMLILIIPLFLLSLPSDLFTKQKKS